MNIKAKVLALTIMLITFSCPLVPTPDATPIAEGVILQEENDLPRFNISSVPFTDLEDNHIGDTFPLDRNPSPCPQVSTDWPFAHVSDLGLKWVRLSLDSIELEQARNWDNYSEFEINKCQEEAIKYLAENGVTILHVLVYWDRNLHADRYPNYRITQDKEQFLQYAYMIAKYFRGDIEYYEILNEAYFYVEVEDYIQLIREVIPLIHNADPDAKIVVGGTTNLMYADQQAYLYEVIQSDIIQLVDGIALHPMYGSSPEYEDIRDYYYDYPNLIQEIKNTAFANGFTGDFFTEEMNWRTAINQNIYEPWEYSPAVAAKYYARGIATNLGLGLWAGIGGENYETIPQVATVIQNLSTIMADFKPTDINVKIYSEAENIVHYTFSNDNGDSLLVIWVDGAAVDDDPGVHASLLFSDLQIDEGIGFDIFEDFGQELVTEEADGNLTIEDLLIKDYPIVIKLVGVDAGY